MTAQIPDGFSLNNRAYSIVGVNGNGLFNPTSMGLIPQGVFTACWRGYICRYALKNDRLVLDELDITLGDFEGEKGEFLYHDPEIKGVKPKVWDEGEYFFSNTYKGLDLKVEFTGGILIGSEFIDELYVHMGFHPAWKYREVVELLFEVGTLSKKRDVSKKIQEFREKVVKYPLRPGVEADKESLKSWIESTFSLDYSF